MTTTLARLDLRGLDTKPSHDPYVNISGVVSQTYLKLDPRDRTVWVSQEYRDNATPMDEWNGLIQTWHVPGHPHKDDMRRWVFDNADRLNVICDGFEDVWDGNNHVGHYSQAALDAIESIRQDLDNDTGPANWWEAWTVEDWLENSLDEITADTTDDQLASAAEDWSEPSNVVLLGDILDYITKRRDSLRADAE